MVPTRAMVCLSQNHNTEDGKRVAVLILAWARRACLCRLSVCVYREGVPPTSRYTSRPRHDATCMMRIMRFALNRAAHIHCSTLAHTPPRAGPTLQYTAAYLWAALGRCTPPTHTDTCHGRRVGSLGGGGPKGSKLSLRRAVEDHQAKPLAHIRRGLQRHTRSNPASCTIRVFVLAASLPR